MSEELGPFEDRANIEVIKDNTVVGKAVVCLVALIVGGVLFYKAHNYLHGDDTPKVKNQIYQIVTVEDSKLLLYYIETNKFPTISMISNLFKTNTIIVSITQK